MLSKVKPRITPLAELLATPFAKIDPNILTLIGSLPPFLTAALIITGQYEWAFLTVILSGFDLLDGTIARMTDRGKRIWRIT